MTTPRTARTLGLIVFLVALTALGWFALRGDERPAREPSHSDALTSSGGAEPDLTASELASDPSAARNAALEPVAEPAPVAELPPGHGRVEFVKSGVAEPASGGGRLVFTVVSGRAPHRTESVAFQDTSFASPEIADGETWSLDHALRFDDAGTLALDRVSELRLPTEGIAVAQLAVGATVRVRTLDLYLRPVVAPARLFANAADGTRELVATSPASDVHTFFVERPAATFTLAVDGWCDALVVCPSGGRMHPIDVLLTRAGELEIEGVGLVPGTTYAVRIEHVNEDQPHVPTSAELTAAEPVELLTGLPANAIVRLRLLDAATLAELDVRDASVTDRRTHVRLHAQRVVDDRPAQIVVRGSVDPEREPTIEIELESRSPSPSDAEPRVTIDTRANGGRFEYTFEVAAGFHRVQVKSRGRRDAPLEVAPGEVRTVDLDLPPLVDLELRCVDALTDEPLGGMWVGCVSVEHDRHIYVTTKPSDEPGLHSAGVEAGSVFSFIVGGPNLGHHYVNFPGPYTAASGVTIDLAVDVEMSLRSIYCKLPPMSDLLELEWARQFEVRDVNGALLRTTTGHGSSLQVYFAGGDGSYYVVPPASPTGEVFASGWVECVGEKPVPFELRPIAPVVASDE